MALSITQQGNHFFVKGIINTNTVKQFKNHLEFLILYTKQLTINIEDVHAIDVNGVNALKFLFNTALSQNKKFKIIGYGCKDVYEEFTQSYNA